MPKYLVAIFICIALLATTTRASADDISDWDTFQNKEDQYKAYPYQTTGPLYFKDSEGLSSQCTATVVFTNILLTAGHCVHKGGTGKASDYHSEFLFCPALQTYPQSYGCWHGLRGMVTDHFYFHGGPDSYGGDVGFIKVKPNPSGELPGDVVSWLPIHFNGPRDEVLYSQGYPAREGYSGNFQHLMNADYGGFLESRDNDTTLTGGNWCRAGGASGSPLIRNFNYEADTEWNRPTHVLSNYRATNGLIVCYWAYLDDVAEDTFYTFLYSSQ